MQRTVSKRLRTIGLGVAGIGLALVPALALADNLAPTGRWSANGDGAARLPPMGWNSWNAFGTDVSEEKVIASAKIIADSGLAAKGYRYIDIDDGWWLKRRQPDGRMVIRTATFPSAAGAGPGGDTSFRPLTDRLHAMGFKAGIYSDIGRNSCGQIYASTAPNQPQGTVAEREVGLYGHVDQDIRLYFADWGFDLIKVDGCGIRGLPASSKLVQAGTYRAFAPIIDPESLGRTDIPTVRGLYQSVGAALKRYNPDRDYLFSICLWGSADVRAWGKDLGNISRTSEDISPKWSRMLHNFDTVSRRALYAHAGSWNDPDMLFVGTGDFDVQHLEEARSHFALWAMENAPLFIGYDLRKASPALIGLLGNTRIIALNQDPAGNQAVLAYDTDDVQILVKTLASGEKAVAIFNRNAVSTDVVLTAAQLKYTDTAQVVLDDVWTGQKRDFRDETKMTLAPHQTRVFIARGERQLPAGLYLSEQPGSVNPAVDGVTVPEHEPIAHRAISAWSGTRGGGDRPRYGGWGGAQADTTPYGETLQVAGHSFATGIGILANSRIEVRNTGFDHFTTLVGVDDSARDRSEPVRFSVYGDGKLLRQSAAMRFGDAAASMKVDVRGVKIIELVARTARPMRFPDPVTWAEAALTR
ncbi:NPCBM/NEW2 domain-containing protein [Sphingomonas sp. TREG-RG-20F-R18-01]|uniref:NPCBM/NEW2 domain-containing protein n=1 Tax=Sphingomonas sp. TREG-RG-20F-R18-01 TaxID=2914982 RepID=UPI001F5A4047|nr:NPCBM/NEW2 domain-containing protein [Sphingomonas sp. TREG-RG-20F-R18-01]